MGRLEKYKGKLFVVSLLLVVLFFFQGDHHIGAVPGIDDSWLKDVTGWIVFDSNRDGEFDIYKMKPDGSSVIRLTDHPFWDIYPDWSPDGTRIVFARHEPGRTRGQGSICIMEADGTNQHVVATEGTFPQFMPDGRGIIFERDRRSVIYLDLAEGKEKQLFPLPQVPGFRYQMVKPRIDPDGGAVLFTTDKGGRWNLWAMAHDGTSRRVGRGCEGVWNHDGSKIYYIAGGEWTGTSIWSAPRLAGKPQKYLSLSGLYRHVYFPSPSADGKYLLFSACPAGQHDHFSANYQIFIKRLSDGKAARVTRNDFTDRWPKLYVVSR